MYFPAQKQTKKETDVYFERKYTQIVNINANSHADLFFLKNED